MLMLKRRKFILALALIAVGLIMPFAGLVSATPIARAADNNGQVDQVGQWVDYFHFLVNGNVYTQDASGKYLFQSSTPCSNSAISNVQHVPGWSIENNLADITTESENSSGGCTSKTQTLGLTGSMAFFTDLQFTTIKYNDELYKRVIDLNKDPRVSQLANATFTNDAVCSASNPATASIKGFKQDANQGGPMTVTIYAKLWDPNLGPHGDCRASAPRVIPVAVQAEWQDNGRATVGDQTFFSGKAFAGSPPQKLLNDTNTDNIDAKCLGATNQLVFKYIDIVSIGPTWAYGNLSVIQASLQGLVLKTCAEDDKSPNNLFKLWGSIDQKPPFVHFYDPAVGIPAGVRLYDPSCSLAPSGTACDTNGDGAPDTAEIAAANGRDAGTTGTVDAFTAQCSQSAGALAWIICPVIQTIDKLLESTYHGIIQPLLNVDPVTKNTEPAAYAVWSAIRNLANVFFVLIFFVIIFANTLSLNIDAYTIKKTLPRLVAAAILVQASFFIASLFVDIGNILGFGVSAVIAHAIPNIGGDNVASLGDKLLTVALGGGLLVVALIVAAPVVVMAAVGLLLAFFALMLTLVLRQIFIIGLVAVSPLAFIAWVLPGTQKAFKLWWENLIKLNLMFPLIALLLGAGALANAIFSQPGGQSSEVKNMIGLLAPTIVFFMIPMTFKWGGKIMSSTSNALQKRASGTHKAIQSSQAWKNHLEERKLKAASRWGDLDAKRQRGEKVSRLNILSKRLRAGNVPIGANSKRQMYSLYRASFDKEAKDMENQIIAQRLVASEMDRAINSGTAEGKVYTDAKTGHKIKITPASRLRMAQELAMRGDFEMLRPAFKKWMSPNSLPPGISANDPRAAEYGKFIQADGQGVWKEKLDDQGNVVRDENDNVVYEPEMNARNGFLYGQLVSTNFKDVKGNAMDWAYGNPFTHSAYDSSGYKDFLAQRPISIEEGWTERLSEHLKRISTGGTSIPGWELRQRAEKEAARLIKTIPAYRDRTVKDLWPTLMGQAQSGAVDESVVSAKRLLGQIKSIQDSPTIRADFNGESGKYVRALTALPVVPVEGRVSQEQAEENQAILRGLQMVEVPDTSQSAMDYLRSNIDERSGLLVEPRPGIGGRATGQTQPSAADFAQQIQVYTNYVQQAEAQIQAANQDSDTTMAGQWEAARQQALGYIRDLEARRQNSPPQPGTGPAPGTPPPPPAPGGNP